jgi:nucleoid DNA-binding protein
MSMSSGFSSAPSLPPPSSLSAPAAKSAYRFAVLAKNRSSKTELAYSAATYQLTNKVKDLAPPTADEIAGTAESATFSSLMAKVNAALQAGSLSPDQKAAVGMVYPQVIIETFKQIKTIVMLGGDVTIDNFGVFAAKWSNERWGRNPSNGDPVLIPAARGTAFTPSLGYKTGTKYGLILTDTQAKTYTPDPAP